MARSLAQFGGHITSVLDEIPTGSIAAIDEREERGTSSFAREDVG